MPDYELAAKLELLLTYDKVRRWRLHDYGAGQRAGEINRLWEQVDDDLYREFGAFSGRGELLRAAFERFGLPRYRRILKGGYRAGTKASTRSIAAWRETARVLGAWDLLAGSER